MDTITAIHSRRSIRRYANRAVSRDLIADILWDASQAPAPPVSGGEPFAFHVIEGALRVAACNDQALAYARAHRPPGRGYNWVDRPDFSIFFNAPAVIVIASPATPDQAVQDCNRAGQNLMLSAHARGLGTCWVGSPMLWLRAPATKAELGRADGLEPYAAFTLGYPDGPAAGHVRPRPAIVWR